MLLWEKLLYCILVHVSRYTRATVFLRYIPKSEIVGPEVFFSKVVVPITHPQAMDESSVAPNLPRLDVFQL